MWKLYRKIVKKSTLFAPFRKNLSLPPRLYQMVLMTNRTSRCDRPDQARDDRFHDDINVLALGADDIDIEMAFLCAQAFLESPFDDCEKRRRRIEKIS